MKPYTAVLVVVAAALGFTGHVHAQPTGALQQHHPQQLFLQQRLLSQQALQKRLSQFDLHLATALNNAKALMLLSKRSLTLEEITINEEAKKNLSQSMQEATTSLYRLEQAYQQHSRRLAELERRQPNQLQLDKQALHQERRIATQLEHLTQQLDLATTAIQQLHKAPVAQLSAWALQVGSHLWQAEQALRRVAQEVEYTPLGQVELGR